MRRGFVWISVSVVLLGLVVWRTRPWEAADLASRLDIVLLLGALLANLVVVLLWAVRSRALMGAVGHPLALRPLIPIVSFANTINNLTPGSTGEVLRAVILQQRHSVPYDASTAVILAERLWAIGIMLVSATAAAIGTLVPASTVATVAAWALALTLSFLPSIAYSFGVRPGRWLARWSEGARWERLRRIGAGLSSMDDHVARIVLDVRRSGHFVVTTALIFVCFAGQLWLVLSAFGSEIMIAGVWAAYGLSICAGVISALPFGLGAADAVLVILLVAQGVDAATAGAAAIVLRAVTTLPLGIAGTASWILLGKRAGVVGT